VAQISQADGRDLLTAAVPTAHGTSDFSTEPNGQTGLQLTGAELFNCRTNREAG
jgi:hypothetical protein